MKHIADQEITARLAADNPWWDVDVGSPLNGPFQNLPLRSYFDGFHRLVIQSEVRRAVILMGPRRVGKTIMIQQVIERLIQDGIEPKSILYVSMDTPIFSGLDLEKLLKLFLNHTKRKTGDPAYIFFDEVQYLRDWEVHLKSLVDTYGAIRFIASGSSGAALKLKSQESGAGRFTDFILPPLTFAEYLRFVDKEERLVRPHPPEQSEESEFEATDVEELNAEFINYLNFGGYPEAVFSPAIQRNPARFIRNDIIDKVLLRDLPSLYGIEDIQELNHLFTRVAYNTGNEINLDLLAKDSGVSKNTIRRYLQYLEAAFLIVRIRRLDERAGRFSRERGFKAYLTNPSMRAALFTPIAPDDAAMGPLVETAIFSQWFHSDHFNRLHYARWNRGEVDILYMMPGKKSPSWITEVKWSDRFFDHPGELTGLIEFLSKNNLNRASVTTRTKSGVKQLGAITLHFEPAGLYCYTVGKNIVGARSLIDASM